MMPFFSNTFNIAHVVAVIDDTLLKPFTKVVHGFAGSSVAEWWRLLVVLPLLSFWHRSFTFKF
jgi:hypothetical protein